jgi:ketosteroid isomerase-like protein
VDAEHASRLVERAYRDWNEGGPHAFVGHTTEDLEMHDAPELPDAGTYVGRAAVVARLEELVAATSGRWAEIEQVRPVGDQVLVALAWRLDRDSEATLAAVFHVVGLRGDRIARVRVFLDEQAALRAAGASAG